MEPAPARASSAARGSGLRAAQAALVTGLAYAAVSIYWGLGGTWLGDTIGGALEKGARAGSAAVVLAIWAAAVLKVIAAVLPLTTVSGILAPVPAGPWWQRMLRILAWTEAAILTSYGLAWTTAGLLVQSGVIAVSAHADHRALAWHAYLWDPWFLLWGLLVTTALIRARRPRSQPPGPVTRPGA